MKRARMRFNDSRASQLSSQLVYACLCLMVFICIFGLIIFSHINTRSTHAHTSHNMIIRSARTTSTTFILNTNINIYSCVRACVCTISRIWKHHELMSDKCVCIFACTYDHIWVHKWFIAFFFVIVVYYLVCLEFFLPLTFIHINYNSPLERFRSGSFNTNFDIIK